MLMSLLRDWHGKLRVAWPTGARLKTLTPCYCMLLLRRQSGIWRTWIVEYRNRLVTPGVLYFSSKRSPIVEGHIRAILNHQNIDHLCQVDRLESSCKEEEKGHWQRVTELQKHNPGQPLPMLVPISISFFHAALKWILKSYSLYTSAGKTNFLHPPHCFQVAFSHFQGLDERINFVATKVVHLGDQLEGVNTPRTRAAEAQRLMKYFLEFMDDRGPTSDLFSDPFQVL